MNNSPEENTSPEARRAGWSETNTRQSSTVVELKFAAALAGSFLPLHKLLALESGIPFSPLND